MIIRGISYLIERDGAKAKYLFFSQTKLDDKEDLENVTDISFKKGVLNVKHRILYYETNNLENYDKKSCWIIFDGFQIYSRNLHKEALKENSKLLMILFSYIKDTLKINIDRSGDTEIGPTKKVSKRTIPYRG